VIVGTLGAPYFAAWSADGSQLLIPTQLPDALVIADAATGAEITSRFFDVSSCVRPHEAVLAADEASVYVVCEGDHETPGKVLALDLGTLETTATFTVGVYPDRLAIVSPP
jgi:hypothetical protein